MELEPMKCRWSGTGKRCGEPCSTVQEQTHGLCTYHLAEMKSGIERGFAARARGERISWDETKKKLGIG